MSELFKNITEFDVHHLNTVLIIGFAIFFGTAGARVFQKLRIPQVVGYVVIGLVIGKSGLNIISSETVESLAGFNMFALGIIGFMIGGELRADVFRKYGKQFFIILVSEGIAAFALVGTGTAAVAYYFTANLHTSVAMGLVLGAIASATAPAATTQVLWEYKTRGPLTRTILAIVALDDGLSLLLFGFASSIAVALMGNTDHSIAATIFMAVYEIAGAVVLGVLAGVVLGFVLKNINEPDKALPFAVSSVLLVIGLSIALKLGSILAAMTLGVTLANFAPRLRKSTFDLVEKFAPPIYVLFFVLAGAHLVLGQITGWMIVMVIVYILARTLGKIFGSWFGARQSKAANAVRKYLGICLLSQAGVAIGLTIISAQLFTGQMGQAIIVIVMTTTLIVEIFGPIFVKLGVKKAGEIGMDVTEEDLIKTYTVGTVMDPAPAIIKENLSLPQILNTFSRNDTLYYPVTNANSKLLGIITIAGIKDTFEYQQAADWLLACDIAQPVLDKTTADTQLAEVIEKMRKFDLEYMPVVSDDDKLVGLVNLRAVNKKINAEILRREKETDEMALAN